MKMSFGVGCDVGLHEKFAVVGRNFCTNKTCHLNPTLCTSIFTCVNRRIWRVIKYNLKANLSTVVAAAEELVYDNLLPQQLRSFIQLTVR